jgi:alkaline phosphatase D
MRGYVFCDVTPETWRTTLRVVDNVRLKTPTFQTLASFVVESGRPGAQTA